MGRANASWNPRTLLALFWIDVGLFVALVVMVLTNVAGGRPTTGTATATATATANAGMMAMSNRHLYFCFSGSWNEGRVTSFRLAPLAAQ